MPSKKKCYSANLETTTTAQDVLRLIEDFFHKNCLSWDSLIGVCTDGAPAMLGSKSGFIRRVMNKNPSIVGTHCILHREALASKTLPDDLKEVLNFVIRIVNYIKSSALNSRLFAQICHDLDAAHGSLFHTNVRWLSKGNMLSRVYELRSEIKEFLQDQEKVELYDAMNVDFELSLSYLVDIFEELNTLNKKLQGRGLNIINSYDTIQGFLAKLELWRKRVQNKNTASFANLDLAVQDSGLNRNLQTLIETHLQQLHEEFRHYFPDIDSKISEWKFIRSPFHASVEEVPEKFQDEFLELKLDSYAKDRFTDMQLDVFWLKHSHLYPLCAREALRVLVPFCSTYLCESGLSTLVALKTKERNRLNIESDMYCALSNIKPRLDDIVARKQCHPSH